MCPAIPVPSGIWSIWIRLDCVIQGGSWLGMQDWRSGRIYWSADADTLADRILDGVRNMVLNKDRLGVTGRRFLTTAITSKRLRRGVDEVPVEDLKRYEADLIRHLRDASDILKTIREGGKLDDDVRAKLAADIDSFNKNHWDPKAPVTATETASA